ncbi:antibiotic biosynthesis monooxygenase [Vibrio sp. Of7-15]|uniref:putative quinol monooxygenase n=1 Tax=Vibrio sp. Of7-15 TaxID=2724879 RepID=UPI001EF169FD|nr:antibiotic biosynthesis monooxygenase [Vibrio sp. Of7-15]MCG7497821.1 antibiotic biosynthesis monooxygenase [Vibrio sp. Of7-15]
MKPLITTCCAIALTLVPMTFTQASEDKEMTKANIITLQANQDKAEPLIHFLSQGVKLVETTEPDTLFWASITSQTNPNQSVIFDTFSSEEAQQAHFEGEVPKALSAQAKALIVNGWEQGVLPNIQDSHILAENHTVDVNQVPTLASVIYFEAKEDKKGELNALLKSAKSIVAETEPGTLHWFALDLGEGKFAIVDFFSNQEALNAHFNGKVASALQANAESLVKGGWESIISNIAHYQVNDILVR